MIKKFIRNESLAKHTTFKIGGPAEYFFETKKVDDLVKAVKYARTQKLPITIIGNGSNILISDKGIKGLVIKNSTSEIKLLPSNQVKLDSGVFLPKAIFYLIQKGLTGLEYFVSIPATVGGATFINMHGYDKFWSDYLVTAEILTPDNQVMSVDNQYFKFAYDYSIIKQSKDIVLTNTLQLKAGDKEAALKTAKQYQLQKAYHPQVSAGCIFENLPKADQEKLGLPTPSTGYLIDKILNLKGKQVGQAVISEKHAGFIENLGGASFQDVKTLIDLIQKTAKDKLNLNLKPEIVIYE